MRLPPSSTLFPYTTLFRSHFRPHRRPVWLAVIAAVWLLAAERTAAEPVVRCLWTPPRAGRSVPAPGTAHVQYTQLFRSEEHTSELQSLTNLVCRLLLEKKN